MTVGDLKITVVGPRKTELEALQKKWNAEIKPMLKKERSRGRLAEIAAYVDKSVHNLSSIVVLVESQGKRILLTGDGRGDHTLEGLKAAKLLKSGKLAVDVLKVPAPRQRAERGGGLLRDDRREALRRLRRREVRQSRRRHARR